MAKKETSKRLASMAAAMLDHPDPAVRSLAGSVLTQFEPDKDPATVIETLTPWHIRQRYSGRDERFWEGFWAGMWAANEPSVPGV